MKKAFLITLVFILGALAFAETKKEQYKKMFISFFDKGSCIIFQSGGNNYIIMSKNSVANIQISLTLMIITYNDASKDYLDLNDITISLDNNNLVITTNSPE